MSKYTLSNHGYMGLGIYLGFKSSFRRQEMASYGVDYDTVIAELTIVGLIKGNRIVKAAAKEAWTERFEGILSSQTHQYSGKLGYNRVGFY